MSDDWQGYVLTTDHPPSEHYCRWDRALVVHVLEDWFFILCPTCSRVWETGVPVTQRSAVPNAKKCFEAAEILHDGDPARVTRAELSVGQHPLGKWRQDNRQTWRRIAA